MKKHIACILALLILTGLTGCNKEELSSSRNIPQLLEPVGVRLDVARVQRSDVFTVSTYNGEMIPYVEELQFVVDGNLDEIKVELGEYVEKGQVLACLSEDTVQKRIEELDEEIVDITKLGEYNDRQMTADIEIAKIELVRMQESGDSRQACRLKEVDVQKLEKCLEQATELRQLDLEEKRRERSALEQRLGNNEMTAPFEGRVVYIRDMESGDAVQSYTTIMCLADESRLCLETDFLSESTISIADKVYAKIGEKEYDLQYLPLDVSEYITKVLNEEEIKTRFAVDAEAGELSSGQFAVIVVLHTYRENVLAVPVNALYQDASGRYVYKMTDGKRVRCDVTVGAISATKAEIVDGLEEGDMVYVKE